MNEFDDSTWMDVQHLIDATCDRAEQELRDGQWKGLDNLLVRVNRRGWERLIEELVKILAESAAFGTQPAMVQYLATSYDEAKPIVEYAIAEHFNPRKTAPSESGLTRSEHREAVDCDPMPGEIDHFHILRELGSGGFGRVFLARDARLAREVVLKIPRPDKFPTAESLTGILDEARKVATFDHPGIVNVFHVGQFQGRPYIVQKFIPGGDLRTAIENRKFTFVETARLLADVADAIAYAHQKRIVHRDLKPANILLDHKGRPHVADFGLALHESQQDFASGEIAGTLKYMSPEQVRGESHRMDGRSDIWALGVLMYRMMVGDVPFKGKNLEEVRGQIIHNSPRPPRQLDASIPPELERICLKCLSKKMNERFNTAVDLASDLRGWLEGKQQEKSATGSLLSTRELAHPSILPANLPRIDIDTVRTPSERVVPRGLSAFDARDQRFFLQLLPGPRDRENLPDQIRFWREKIESFDIEHTFLVGLIYGPSGCGKSSLVRAGILPRLSPNVRTVYVEATQADTEVRILVGLRKHLPEIPREHALPQIISELRQGKWLAPGEKIVIVIDQFEQWLHANDIHVTNQLVEALRHCDGRVVQTLILARDDFWMAVSRFFQELELPLVEYKNFAAVDLFDPDHARSVLLAFGQAYGKLPMDGQLAPDQSSFLDVAIKQLSEQDKIICVRLVLFAETVKSKVWTIEVLKQLGSVQQIGTLFLEQSLDARTVNPTHRLHAPAIRRILEKLLPETGTDIKAHFQSREQLAEAAGKSVDSAAFQAILDILDKQLRLITPTEPNFGADPFSEPNQKPDSAHYYQLTHDFLVASIRNWLEKNDSKSFQGRTRNRFVVLSNYWSANRESRFLPTIFEFIAFRVSVRSQTLRTHQKAFLVASTTKTLKNAIAMAIILFGIISIARFSQITLARNATRSNIQAALDAQAQTLPGLINKLETNSIRATELLSNWDQPIGQERSLRMYCLRGHFDPAFDGKQLIPLIATAASDECQNIVSALKTIMSRGQSSGIIETIRERISNSSSDSEIVRLAIIAIHLDDYEPVVNCLRKPGNTVVRTRFAHELAVWRANLNDIVDCASTLSDADLQVPFCKAFSLLSESSGTENDRLILEGFGRKFFKCSPSSGVHLLCKQILEKLNVDTSILGIDPSLTGMTWQDVELLQGHRMTFVVIPPGVAPFGLGMLDDDPMFVGGESAYGTANPEVRQAFLISSEEVSLDLFCKFVDAQDTDPVIKSYFESQGLKGYIGKDLPISGITRDEAAQFCNWISRKSGLMEPYAFDNGDWLAVENANGYRLPTVAEWEIACRAGTETPYFFGDNSLTSLLPFYCWCATSPRLLSKRHVGARGQNLPNDLGIFDTIGNASEWMHDSVNEIRELQKKWYALRGGCTMDPVRTFRSTWFMEVSGDMRTDHAGIRLVRRK